MNSREQVIDQMLGQSCRSSISNSSLAGRKRELMGMNAFNFAQHVWQSYNLTIPAVQSAAANDRGGTAVLDEPDDYGGDHQPLDEAELRERLKEQLAILDAERAELRSTAMHEAGHAVPILTMGGRIARISASSSGGGCCSHEPLSQSAKQSVLLGGFVGQNLDSNWSEAFLQAHAFSQDKQDLMAEMRESLRNSRPSYMVELEISDERLFNVIIGTGGLEFIESEIKNNRPLFNALVEELVEFGELSGDRVHELWDSWQGHLEARLPWAEWRY